MRQVKYAICDIKKMKQSLLARMVRKSLCVYSESNLSISIWLLLKTEEMAAPSRRQSHKLVLSMLPTILDTPCQ